MATKIHYKDETPTKTVEKIKGILASMDIQTEEEWYPSGVTNCHSMRVSVPGADFGTNGKGINEDFTRASGYAEFIERLQAGFLSKDLMRDYSMNYPDARFMSKEECAESCKDWFAGVSKGMSELFDAQVSEEFVRDKCFECAENDGTIQTLPFCNVTKGGKLVYFPKKSFPLLYSSNGMAAGNTLEEAIVQAMSEIYERYNVIRFFCNDITPPTIPEDYLRQLEKPWATIESLKNSGFDVIIKDCSMGEDFPMIAAVAIDKKNHSYKVHMGAHPVFEIALERSLTEMFQGKNIDIVTATRNLIVPKKGERRPIAEVTDHVCRGNGEFSLAFFAGKPAYEFRPFKDRSAMSNAQMMEEFYAWFVNKGYDVYLRDISHLGFPTVIVAVPGMSEPFPHYLVNEYPESRMYQKFKTAPFELDKLTPQELREYRGFLKYRMDTFGNQILDLRIQTGKDLFGRDYRKEQLYGRMVYAYVEWYFNKAMAVSMARTTMKFGDREQENHISCVCTYVEHLMAGIPDAQIYDGLRQLYPEELVLQVRMDLMMGQNPFAPYLIHCKPELCDACEHKNVCLVNNTEELLRKVDREVAKFDNDAAFDRIRKLFKV